MRLLICAGGTGGGVYPALSVLQATIGAQKAEDKSANSVLWVGGAGGIEADLVERTGIPFRTISAAGIHGVGLRALPGNLLQLLRGYWQSRRIIRQHQPDVLFYTGGYVAVPMALAGRKLPSLIFVPDIEPGLALKLLARFTRQIAVVAQAARSYFPSGREVTVTGYPVRSELKTWDLELARETLDLSAGLPTLLVFGGSKGARSINRALLAVLPDLLNGMQIVHVCGRLDWPEVKAAQSDLVEKRSVPVSLAERYHPYPYLHEEMGAALKAADLVISRAGAATLGEFPLFGLPAILVPYPHAWRYQRVNAEYLAQHGAAEILDDKDLSKRLLPLVQFIMRDSDKRQQMRLAMRSLAQPEAAQSISKLLHSLAEQ